MSTLPGGLQSDPGAASLLALGQRVGGTLAGPKPSHSPSAVAIILGELEEQTARERGCTLENKSDHRIRGREREVQLADTP